MCTHKWIKMNDTSVCTKCGLTVLPDKTMFFDKTIVNYKSKKRKVNK